jgi:hypothetical protein
LTPQSHPLRPCPLPSGLGFWFCPHLFTIIIITFIIIIIIVFSIFTIIITSIIIIIIIDGIIIRM